MPTRLAFSRVDAHDLSLRALESLASLPAAPPRWRLAGSATHRTPLSVPYPMSRREYRRRRATAMRRRERSPLVAKDPSKHRQSAAERGWPRARQTRLTRPNQSEQQHDADPSCRSSPGRIRQLVRRTPGTLRPQFRPARVDDARVSRFARCRRSSRAESRADTPRRRARTPDDARSRFRPDPSTATRIGSIGAATPAQLIRVVLCVVDLEHPAVVTIEHLVAVLLAFLQRDRRRS